VFNELKKAEQENGILSDALPAALKTVFTLCSIPINRPLSTHQLTTYGMPIRDLFQLQEMMQLLEGEDCCGGSLTIDLSTLRRISTKGENRHEHDGNTREQICRYLDFIGLGDQRFTTTKLSPTYSVTLPHKKRQLANIPEEATHYCFCYPLASSYAWPEGVNKADPLLDLFQVGGYVYLQQEKVSGLHVQQLTKIYMTVLSDAFCTSFLTTRQILYAQSIRSTKATPTTACSSLGR
jgi:hypothetical protein